MENQHYITHLPSNIGGSSGGEIEGRSHDAIYQLNPRQAGPFSRHSTPENIYLKIRMVDNRQVVYVVDPHGERRHRGLQDLLEFEYITQEKAHLTPPKAALLFIYPYARAPGDIFTVEFVESKYMFIFRCANGNLQWCFSYNGDDNAHIMRGLGRLKHSVKRIPFYKYPLVFMDSRNMMVLRAMLQHTARNGRICPRWIGPEDDGAPHEHVQMKICTNPIIRDADEAFSNSPVHTVHYLCRDTPYTAIFKTLCDLNSDAKFSLEMKGRDSFYRLSHWKDKEGEHPLTVMERFNMYGGVQPMWAVPKKIPITEEFVDDFDTWSGLTDMVGYTDQELECFYEWENFLGFSPLNRETPGQSMRDHPQI